MGISARIDGRSIAAGNRRLMDKLGITLGDDGEQDRCQRFGSDRQPVHDSATGRRLMTGRAPTAPKAKAPALAMRERRKAAEASVSFAMLMAGAVLRERMDAFCEVRELDVVPSLGD